MVFAQESLEQVIYKDLCILYMGVIRERVGLGTAQPPSDCCEKLLKYSKLNKTKCPTRRQGTKKSPFLPKRKKKSSAVIDRTQINYPPPLCKMACFALNYCVCMYYIIICNMNIREDCIEEYYRQKKNSQKNFSTAYLEHGILNSPSLSVCL